MARSEESEYTAESCFSCRKKKRKCDKRMPACSRCVKLSQQCLYGSHGVYGTITPITNEEMLKVASQPRSSTPVAELPARSWKSCRNCNKQKKFCDKAYPACARCKRANSPCTYDNIDRLQRLSTQHFFSSGLTRSIDEQPSYPVASRSYIPMFIRFFQDQMGLAALQVDFKSLAYHLRSSWIRHALTDSCLFHATLYSASAQMDAMRNMPNNYITLYHHHHTIKLLNKRLCEGAVDDVTIASVLLLLISGSVQKESHAAEVHRKGLLRLVAMRGGLDKLGFDGFLSEMIQMNMVLPAVVFDQADDPHPPAQTEAAPDLPSLALDKLRDCTRGDAGLKSHLIDIFSHIQALLQVSETSPQDISIVWDTLDSGFPRSDDALSPRLSASENALLRACWESLRILQYLLDNRLPWLREEISCLLAELSAAMTLADPMTRLRYAPEASLWVTVVGMAASPDVNGRLCFLMNERCVVMSVKSSKVVLHERFLDCYRRLRALVRVREASLDSEMNL